VFIESKQYVTWCNVAGLKKTSTMILEHNGIAGVNGGFHAYGRPDVGTITEMRVDGVNVVTQNTPEQVRLFWNLGVSGWGVFFFDLIIGISDKHREKFEGVDVLTVYSEKLKQNQ
jgi:hypothetical protein